MKDSHDINELEWIRIFDPQHIPRKYVEQIKDRRFEVDRFYIFQANANFITENGSLQLNPYNLLYALCTSDKAVKGFCWMFIDTLTNALVINSFSMDNAYWGGGKCVRLLEQKAKEIKRGAGLDKIYWITRCPKHSEKYGFKKSKNVLMECRDDGTDTIRESSSTNRESRIDDKGADELSQQSDN